MKILVCAKRVVDPNVKVRIKTSGLDVDIEHSKMSLNPFDETAIEEAVLLKERGIASEIVVVSIGDAKSEEVLRLALARGCDRAILMETPIKHEPINIAHCLRTIVERELPQLILLGKQAIDDDSCQVAGMLGGMLDMPQLSFISKLEINANRAIVNREIDSGTQTLSVELPAILSVDLNLNAPRFIRLPQLMQAKKKPIEKIILNELSLSLTSRTRLLSVMDGEIKRKCQFLANGDELVDLMMRVQSS